MPSPLRTPITPGWIALAVTIMISVPVDAQHPSAQTSVAISIKVQPTLAIRGVVAGPVRRESAQAVATTSVVSVESNLPYRVSVRLAASPGDARILVRNVAGAFEPLVVGGSVTAVVSPAAGQAMHDVVCRIESAVSGHLDAARCALVYELSAEYNDSLLRTTATPTVRPPVAGAFAVADAPTGR